MGFGLLYHIKNVVKNQNQKVGEKSKFVKYSGIKIICTSRSLRPVYPPPSNQTITKLRIVLTCTFK